MESALANRRYRLGVRMFTAAVRWVGYWMLAAAAVTMLIAIIASNRSEPGMWTTAVSVSQWFVGGTAGVWLYTLLPVHIAQGVTRRELTVAWLVFGTLATVAMVAVSTAGFVAEQAVHELTGDPGRTWAGALGAGLRYLVVTPIYFFAGTAVAALIVRIGLRWLAIVAALAFAGASYAGTAFVEYFQFGGSADASIFATWAGSALALLAALIVIFVLVVRSVPIRPKAG